MGGQSPCRPPLCAGVPTPHGLPLDAILVTQFVRGITGGEAGGRSGHLFTILHFYSFDLQKGDRLGEVLCDQEI